MKIPLRRFLIAGAAAIFLILSSTPAHTDEGHRVFLTRHPKTMVETDRFGCREKIYIYASLDALPAGHHKAEAHWTNPKGVLQQISAHDFDLTEAGRYDTWLWLKLKPGFGGEFFGTLDDSIGMGEFFGRWRVELFLDGRAIDERYFFVAC